MLLPLEYAFCISNLTELVLCHLFLISTTTCIIKIFFNISYHVQMECPDGRTFIFIMYWLFINFFCIRQENKKSNWCISVLSFLYKFYVCNVVQILIFFCLVVSRINSSKVGILMIITFCPQKSLEAKLTSVTSNIVT